MTGQPNRNPTTSPATFCAININVATAVATDTCAATNRPIVVERDGVEQPAGNGNEAIRRCYCYIERRTDHRCWRYVTMTSLHVTVHATNHPSGL